MYSSNSMSQDTTLDTRTLSEVLSVSRIDPPKHIRYRLPLVATTRAELERMYMRRKTYALEHHNNSAGSTHTRNDPRIYLNSRYRKRTYASNKNGISNANMRNLKRLGNALIDEDQTVYPIITQKTTTTNGSGILTSNQNIMQFGLYRKVTFDLVKRNKKEHYMKIF